MPAGMDGSMGDNKSKILPLQKETAFLISALYRFYLRLYLAPCLQLMLSSW